MPVQIVNNSLVSETLPVIGPAAAVFWGLMPPKSAEKAGLWGLGDVANRLVAP